MCGIAQEDDDANSTSGKKAKTALPVVDKARIEAALATLNQHFEAGEDDKAKTMLDFAIQEDVTQVVDRYYQLYPLD